MSARMDPATGLLPGQSWAIPADGPWQARLDRAGRAHVIGRALAEHPEYGGRYLDPARILAGVVGHPVVVAMLAAGAWVPRNLRPRPWHTFERACRAARLHERMVIAAKRTEAQAGQGG